VAQSSIVIFVFSASNLTANRGAIFIRQLTGFLRYINPELSIEDLKQKLKDIIIPVLVQYSGTIPNKIKASINKIINAIEDKYIKRKPESQNLYNGYEFPQSHEVEQFRILCDLVRDHYICIDPEDQVTAKKFDDDGRRITTYDFMIDIKDRFKSARNGQPGEFNDDLPL
jgi:hypothetical protein